MLFAANNNNTGYDDKPIKVITITSLGLHIYKDLKN
jgi:hypothetical protein